MEESSSFFNTPDFSTSEEFSSLRLIHCSEHGFCDIFRIDRGGRFRALKCLKPQYRKDSLYQNLLRKEFEIGYSLDHPNICEYYSFTQVEGLGNCIEMEWVDGRSLETVISEENPTIKTTDHIIEGICDALSYLHSKQIIHRDLKPSNILVTFTGDNVRLIDFGFSDSDSHSILKAPAGTAGYTAPEVLQNGKTDIRTDIYSLGVIMSRLSGRYRKTALKCCRKAPSARYSSVAEVKKAIQGRRSLHIVLILMAIAAAAGLILLWLSEKKQSPIQSLEPENTVVPAVNPPDSVKTETAIPTESQVSKPATPAVTPKKDTAVDPAIIDELFRQATELFD